MKKDKTFKWTQLLLLLINLYLAIFKNFVEMAFSGKNGGEMLVRKYNFLSPVCFGYGNYFPLVFVIIDISSIIYILLKLKGTCGEKEVNVLRISYLLELVILFLPVGLKMQQANSGLNIMLMLVAVQIFYASYFISDKNRRDRKFEEIK